MRENSPAGWRGLYLWKLGAGMNCVENVYFTPTGAGIRTGALTFRFCPKAAITVHLTGNATATAIARLPVLPRSLDFNGYTVSDNPDQIVTMSNGDGVPVARRAISLSGSTAFTFNTTCGSIVAADSSCTVDVTFTPIAVGSYVGTLIIPENTGTIHQVPLSGTAVSGR